VSALLHRWQVRYGRGEDVSAAELCRDHPELAGELARRIQALRATQRFIRGETPAAGRGERPTVDGRALTPALSAPDEVSPCPAPILPG
jgi:hypothetical protein